MIWSYLIHLSTHMWDDENTPPRGWYLPPRYTPENNVDLTVWDDTVDFLAAHGFNMVLVDVGDGMKYESHPDVSAPDAWDKDFLKKKLGEMRAKGLEPIPKLNFSAGHHTWLKEYRRMVSSKIYYEVCADLIGEICEVFDSPRLFHLGMDEETDSICSQWDITVIRRSTMLWHDFYFFFDECAKHGMRPWVWSDYYWWGSAKLFAEKMPRDVLQSNWYYRNFTDLPENDIYYRNIKCYEDLDKLGFEQVPTASTCSTSRNALQTMEHCSRKLSKDKLLGYMTAPWYFCRDDEKYILLNDAYRFYKAREKVYPESLGK